MDLLVIHTLFRPPHTSETLKQDDLLSLRKLAGEGKISEQKTWLGWDIKTNSLRVFTPKEKQTACTTDIKESVASKKIKIDTLELLIGNLNHAVHAIKPAQ